ncbi:sugar ABC transporter substrate-binding protein [Kribbella sandramycini]|uniref:Multiple sugar transport system substrate-binding protein n=1 Tax=Kribbella sandramycini TaxID=60450 RepID=A0A7Y4P3L3_9ACTN|nr:sugar ABC transporter substrate-binding protein [Kribbella sandramycini]MBB6570319.1 multiple sugar transport system substrate-binding protein [Kribbella sandramycini]NOL45183.1 sugar ABC transporter substrate-binding protein [Kribbella sandramycini]
MTRKTLLAPAIVAVAALLAGCSSGSGSSESDGPVTITYGIWAGTQTPAMQEIATAFTAENPNITVKIQERPYPEFWSTLQTSAAGGTAPDAFWMLAQQIRPYAAGNQLLDISDAVKEQQVDLAKYPKAVLDLYDQGDGKLYGLPKDVDTNAVWFNKALFDKAGVAYPKAGWTWADFRETAKKLTDPAAGTWGVAAPLDYQGGYYNSIFQAGGKVIADDGKTAAIDSPEAQAGIRFWTDLQADKSSPTLQQLSDTEAETMFEQGKVAMYVSGAYWALKLYDNQAIRAKVDVAPLPTGVKQATVTSGIENVGYAGTKHPEAVKKFLLFASGEKAANIQAKSGAVLPAYQGAEKTWMNAMPEFKNLQVFIDAKAYSVPLPVQGNAAEWQGLQAKYLTPAWDGKVSVADATAQYADAIDKVLAENG